MMEHLQHNGQSTRGVEPISKTPKDPLCWKSWDPDGRGPRGICCCNCKSHRKLFSHPWVDKKPFSHTLGWVCVTDGVDPKRATLSNKHGLCELHESAPKSVKRKMAPVICERKAS
jgi:hypothetical protein